jgi:predicted ATPase/DNA-binding SARP family transcriptional activator
MGFGHLPVRLSSFIGRETELAELDRLVASARLVTLTGPGGAGKTRLSMALARRLEASFGQGAWWLGLAAVTEPAGLPAALSDALKLPQATGMPAPEAAARLLAGGRALLVVDNCEHLLAPVARLVAELLTRCPELTVLATSQEPLGIAGETVFFVPPLPAPADGTSRTAAGLAGNDAVRLFTERARAAWHRFELTDANAADVALICRKLDGVPLAIELAAAWVPALSPAQLATRLDDGLRVLAGGDRDALPRHHTLRAALDWSWALLPEPERRLLARLSVFPAAFTVDAVEAVAGDLDGEVLHLLCGLVNRSWVMVQHGDQVRYRLLQLVRQYGSSKLTDPKPADSPPADSPPADSAPAGGEEPARRLAEYVVGLVERAAGKLDGPEQQDWLAVLADERDTIRTAVDWCCGQGRAEWAMRIAVGVWWASYLQGRYGEGREWLENSLRLPGDVPADLRARALIALGTLAHLQGDAEVAAATLREGFAAYRADGDRAGEAMELNWLGGVAMRRGEYLEARRLGERCLESWRAIGDESKVSRALDFLCMRELLAGELDRASGLAREAHSRYRRYGDSEGLAWVTMLRGAVAHYQGEQTVARTFLAEAERQSRAGGFTATLAWTLQLRGQQAARDGELDRSEQNLAESLGLHRDAGNRWRAASVVEILAATAAARGTPEVAARLLACAAAVREQLDTPVPAVERPDVEATRTAVHAALSPDRLARCTAEGQLLTIDQVGGQDTPAAPLTIVEARVEPLEVQALGNTLVRRGETLLGPSDWSYAKPRELFHFLLGEQAVRKEQIGAALWPEITAPALRNSFHTCLHQLRRTLGRSDRITFRAGRYAFNRALEYSYDVERFEAAVATAAQDPTTRVERLAEAVRLYRGDYLADLIGQHWADSRREALRQQFERSLLVLGELQVAAGRDEAAVELYERAVAHDPLLEPAHRALIACHLRMGDQGGAARRYRDLVTVLADELGVRPSPETRALLRGRRT